MKISILIPLYNHEKFIKYTIESILNQSYKDFEILISDDNSTDQSLKVVESIKDERIKIFKNDKNYGPAINFNKLIDKATGSYLMLLASDDALYENALSKYLDRVKNNSNLALCYTWFQTIDEQNQEIDSFNMKVGNKNRNPDLYLHELFYSGNYLMGSGLFINKEIFKKTNKFNPFLIQTQDYELVTRLLCMGLKISVIEDKIIKYRIHSSNLSNNLNNSDIAFINESRYLFEIQKVLENYLKIEDFELFKKTFPSTLDYEIVDPKYKIFYLMNEAIKVGYYSDSLYHVGYKLFASNLAYSICNNEELFNEICSKFNFSFLDFKNILSSNINKNNITHLYDLFSQNKIKEKSKTKRIFDKSLIKFLK